MITCTVCGEAYWPTGRWREDLCDPCYAANFAASQELRVQHAPVTDAQRLDAIRRMAERGRQEEDA
jgi:hypothetical protein